MLRSIVFRTLTTTATRHQSFQRLSHLSSLPTTLSSCCSSPPTTNQSTNRLQHQQQQDQQKRFMNSTTGNSGSNSSSSNEDESPDSHSDFGPVKKEIPTLPTGKNEVHYIIQQHITKNPVMVYMKGNPNQPMCGFSATVIQILQSYQIDISSVNVLDYPSIRDGIKTFSNWPTIPQVYINGEFIGGCDIIKNMHTNGELKDLLKDIIPKEEEK